MGFKKAKEDVEAGPVPDGGGRGLSMVELEEVTAVFHCFETGLREATIHPKDLHVAMHRLGLNPTDQQVVDIPNKIAKKGLIYYPDFCNLTAEWLRKDEDEPFHQIMFKMLCGTDSYPKDFKAKKYKLDKHTLRKEDFVYMMKNLPAHVNDDDIDEMFEFADKNHDGELSYSEFLVMISPPAPPETPRPHISQMGMDATPTTPLVDTQAASPTLLVDAQATSLGTDAKATSLGTDGQAAPQGMDAQAGPLKADAQATSSGPLLEAQATSPTLLQTA